MRKIRSDFNLRCLLDLTHDSATSEQVKSCIRDVIDHAAGTRGNRALLDLLTFAIRQAETAGEAETATRLDDALGYATGRVLSVDIESKYQLLSGSSDKPIELMDLIYSNVNFGIASIFDDYLKNHPQASVTDAREYFARLGKRSIRIVEDRKTGRYEVLRHDVESQAWLAEAMLERTSFGDLESPANASTLPKECLTLLGRTDADMILAAMAVHLRRAQLERARRIIEHPYSSERQIQDTLSGSWWLFGGDHIGESLRRRLTTGLEVDVPVIRPDGVLHLVELKRANVPVIRRHRRGTILTAVVHEAVGQVMDYLRVLDERRDTILAEYRIDARRASATVVVGHPGLQTEFDEAVVDETLRTYNSHLTRIDVITYKQLLDNAARALELADVTGAGNLFGGVGATWSVQSPQRGHREGGG